VGKVEFAATVDVKASPERAFDYFADYRHVASVLDSVSKWEPVGTRTKGVGARYAVEMVALGLPLRNVLRLDRWRRPREIGWVSESGLIENEGGFTFAPLPKGVRIELRIAYVPPAGTLGAAAARRLDGIVRRRLEGALERIRDTLEGQPA
jgi:uncharacterized membrane protein